MTVKQPVQHVASLPGLPDADRGGTLEGIVVIELTQTLAGEFAGGLLTDLGATVIKIEPPAGSPLRRRGPALAGEDALYFQSENRGKYSVCAEVSALRQEPWFARLLVAADAIIEDLGPGRLEAVALSPEALQQCQPRLCCLRISPFGHTGPLAGERGDDRIAQAFANVQFTTGFPDRPPIPVTVPLADYWTGVHGVNGLLMAMWHARRSGCGQVVDLALYETALRLQEAVVVQFDQTGTVAARFGTQNPGVAPANIYPTRDGKWIALSGAGDQPFVRLCEAIEAPEAPHDPRFATMAARLQHRQAIDDVVRAWVARHDLADVEARFFAVGVAGTAIQSVDDILADEHVQARQAFLTLRSQTGHDFLAPAPVPKFARTPARQPLGAPRLGEHTSAVQTSLETMTPQPRLKGPAEAGDPSGGPLHGLRVLDLSQWLAGPAAATLLADFGAEVIMVELPTDRPAPRPSGTHDLGFLVTNRNKRSVTLDVRTPAGRAVFFDLLRVSDVIVENFRPGTLERWNLGPDTLLDINPRLVLLRASGFGQSGPYSRRSAFNPVGLAFGGMTYLNGWPDRPPLRDGVLAGDYGTALFNVLGVLAALLRRDRDGQGQVVDVAMYEAVLRMTGDMLAVWSALGMRRERAGGEGPVYPSSLTAAAADGRFVAVSSATWEEVFAALERLGRPRSEEATHARQEIVRVVGALPAEEAVSALRRAGLAASVVHSIADVVREPHLWSRGNLVRLAYPQRGEIVTQGVVPRLSRTPGRITGWSRSPGSDNAAVLGGILGYTPQHIRRVTEPVQSGVPC
jgi:crotonobetainyl-CoA:carnitine CoA-transferase CaiB-like acyl-CoA transferase